MAYPMVLDPSCGKGEFLIESAKRMAARGCRDVLTRLWVADFSQLNLLMTRKRLENWARNPNNNQQTVDFVNIIKYNSVEDLVQQVGNMKFDVIVGNPPYLNGLWVKFLRESVKMSIGHVALVSPDGTKNFSKKSEKLNVFLKENGVQNIVDCTKHFPKINSGTIAVYHIDVKKEYNPKSFLAQTIDQKILEKIIVTSLPKLESISNNKAFKLNREPRYEEEADGRTLQIERIVKNTPSFKWIESKNTQIIEGSDYWLTNRFFGKSKDAPMIEHIGTVGLSFNILAIKKIPDWNFAEFKTIYLSKLMRYAINVLRNGMFDTKPQHLRQLPIIDKNTKDLYKYFNLTPEEIAHVESKTK